MKKSSIRFIVVKSSTLSWYDFRQTSGTIERSLNSVTLIGRVGTEPTLRGTANKPVLTFR